MTFSSGTTLESAGVVALSGLTAAAAPAFSCSQQATPSPSATPSGGAPGRVALGNNADLVPNLEIVHSVLPPPGTVTAWHLRSLGRDILKKNGVSRRMRWCGSRISRGGVGVSVYARPDRAYGRLGGVCVCGQSVCCPVCAPRIAARRAARVGQAFQSAKAAGFDCSLETFTKPHVLSRKPDALAREIVAFAALWRKFQHHAGRRSDGLIGYHVAREITWGGNGWHYHHHRLRYDKPGTFEVSNHASGIYNEDETAWWGALDSFGLLSDGAKEHSYNCGSAGDEAGARYIAKMSTSVEAQARSIGSEIASAATKGRNLNSLLADHARGDLQAGFTWLNGVCVVTAKKVSSVRWSRGLAAKFGMRPEKDDKELAKEEELPTDQFLGALNSYQWEAVLKWRAEFALCCAANQGLDSVNQFLSGLNVGQLNEEDPRLLWRASNKQGY